MNMHYQLNPYNVGETSPVGILSTEKVPFYLTVINVKVTSGAPFQETYVVKLDKKGGYSGKVLLDSGNSPINTRIALLSKKRILTSWYNFGEDKAYNQLLKPTLKKVKGPYSLVSGISSTSGLVGLSNGGAFQVLTTFPGFHTARFNSKGKMQGSPVYHDSIGLIPNHMMLVEVKGHNKVLMVWRRAKGSNSAEIAGSFFAMD